MLPWWTIAWIVAPGSSGAAAARSRARPRGRGFGHGVSPYGGGRCRGIVASLGTTAGLNEVEPLAWLTDVLASREARQRRRAHWVGGGRPCRSVQGSGRAP